MTLKITFTLIVIGGLILAFSVAGCSSAKLAIANKIAASEGSYTVKRDVAYGADPRQQLDIYLPKNPKNTLENAPVLVFFYGGSWQTGSRTDYEFAAQPFADAGYIVVIPDYAKYPAHQYPAFMEDAAKAVHWVSRHIQQYGGNPQHIYLAGHSAGGHIAALLGTDKKYLGKTHQQISGVIGLSGAYDFTPKEKDIKAIFAPANPVHTAMPAHYIDGTQPPFLLIWGANDNKVGRQNIDQMQAAIDEKGGQLEVVIYPELNHIGTVAALAIPKRASANIVETMLKFMQQEQSNAN